MPLSRIAVGSCAALFALLLVAAFLHGGGGESFHILGTQVTPTVEMAGLPAPDFAAGRSEAADLDRLAGTGLVLVLLSSVTVLATLLGVIAAENLSLQGRLAIEVMLGAPPGWLVGAAARRWIRRLGVAAVLGALLCVGAVAAMAARAPSGTVFATPATWPFAAVVAVVVAVVLAIAALPVVALYRRGRPLSQEAESQHSTDPRPRQFGRVLLITLQLCIAVATLASAGLLVLAGESRPDAAPPAGPDTGSSIVGLVSPVGDSARDPARRAALFASALASLRDAPGTVAESLATPGAWIGRGPEVLALNECGGCSTGGMPHPVHSALVKHHAVMPGFFAERGLPLVDGGGFGTGAELAAVFGAENVAGEVVINEAYSRAHFQDPPAVGKRVAIGGLEGSWYVVVGVVRDASGSGLGASSSRYAVYYSAMQHPPERIELVASAAAPGSDLEDSLRVVREALAAVHGTELALGGFKSTEDELERVYGTAGWLGGGARGAGLLAAVAALAGMVGALRAHVRSRHREMGIRSALGADPSALHRMVLREALRIGAVGVGLGLWVAMLIAGALGPPGVPIFNPALFLLVALVFVAAAVVAALPGARLAASSDPRALMDG